MRKLAVPMAAAAVVLAACGTSAADRAAQSMSPVGTTAGTRISVVTCGETITFDTPPTKAIVLGDTSVSNLDALGLLDRVAHRAGDAHFAPSQPELQARYDALPALESGRTDTGGVTISTEAVLKTGADLVIGYDKGVEKEKLTEAGIPLYTPEAYCPEFNVDRGSFSLIDDELRRLAQLFGEPERAESVIAELHGKVEGLKAGAVAGRGTAAALYMPAAATQLRVYGATSMVQPIFEVNGLTNAYADNPKRVFDGTMEDLLERDPEWIVLLSSGASDEETIATFRSFNGAEQLQAMTRDQVVVIPFVLTDPPNVLSVAGATMLSEKLSPTQ